MPTEFHMMASIDHLHQDFLMLKVRDHTVITSQVKNQDPVPLRKLSTLDITQLFFQESAQPGKKASRTCTHTWWMLLFNSKETTVYERLPTPNSRQGAKTKPETMMHSLITMIKTLPSTVVGLQAQGVQLTK